MYSRKDKKQFEEYKKAMKTMPDKKEREEIESLKKEVSYMSFRTKAVVVLYKQKNYVSLVIYKQKVL